jgi:hypothetical protein
MFMIPNQAFLIIAEVICKNPNGFYELQIMHSWKIDTAREFIRHLLLGISYDKKLVPSSGG